MLEAIRGTHPYRSTSAPIDRLPHELLLAVFELYVDLDTPVLSLVTLILVCKLWRNIVEGTPSLWCRISGREALSSVRKALAMSNGVPLEITYWEEGPNPDPEMFFTEVKDRIAHSKSITVTATTCDSFNHLLAILETTVAPKLETLHLLAPWDLEWERGSVTLFGGDPAPPALKDFHVEYVQIALGPLHLSGLRSLQLNDMPIDSAEELLRILRDSPALEDCSMQRLVLPTEFTPVRSQSSMTGPDCRAIQLLHLRHLSLLGLPVSFTHFLLSKVQLSTLLSFSVECRLHESPASELLTGSISHLASALKASTATAEEIELNSLGDQSWTLYAGTFSMEFEGLPVEPRYVKETFDWVFGHLGERLQDLPINFVTHEFSDRADLILWLGSNLRVAYLELWTPLWLGGEHNGPRSIISFLSRPVAPTSDEWALPDLESIDTFVLDEAGKLEILEMVAARHSFIQAQEAEDKEVTLEQFREIRLQTGNKDVPHDQASDTRFLGAIEKVGRGAEIWWEGVKWIGDRI